MSLNKFILLADRLVEFEAFLNDKQTPLASRFIVETHQDELKGIWRDLKLSCEQCLSDIEQEAAEEKEAGREDEASDVATVKSKFQSAYSTYSRCSAKLREILHELSSAPTNVPPAPIVAPVPTSTTQYGFKLPPCEIPIFHGEYSSWPTYRDIFTAVCKNNPRLSPVERLFHLNHTTKGEPHDIVSKVPLTNENFDVAWSNLCARYENRRVLVNIQLKSLFSLSTITIETGESLKALQRDINACISLLNLYGVDVNSWGPIFVFVCCKCLPDNTLTLWEQTLENKAEIPKWSDLDEFLTNRHRTLESVSEIRKSDNTSSSHNNNSTGKKSNQTRKDIRTFQNNVTQGKCSLCHEGNHVIRKCPRFLKMDVSQRYQEIKKNGLCVNCFSRVHTVQKCNSKFSCQKCYKRHNTLLHRENESMPSSSALTNAKKTSFSANASDTPPLIPTSIQSSIQSTNMGSGVIQSCFASDSKGVLLGTAIVHISHCDVTYVARALVDSGSQGTFISERLFNTLKLPFKRITAQISGLNNTVSAAVQKECSLALQSVRDPNVEVLASALVVPHLSGNLPTQTIDLSALPNIPDIPLADPLFFESSKIDLLIGGDLLPSIMLSGIQREVCGSLLAQETVFGWILTGPALVGSVSSFSSIVSYFCEIFLDKEISRFWEVEDLPRKKFLSQAENFCEDLYRATTKRNVDGRYEVSLPFKQDYPSKISIGPCRDIALAQFYKNESRLLRNPLFKKEYDSVLQEYVALGHMRRVEPSDTFTSVQHYYLPHHAVVKPESTTTRVRVVFNASSASSNGMSLNDVLHPGPILQQDLIVLILRWRFFRFVFNGDITKMYRQIWINPNQTQFQRILFRENPNEKVQDFELRTVTFGVNCAPFLAIRTMLQIAEDVHQTNPLASEIIRNSMYVDDIIAGAHSVTSALESRNQLIDALNSAGFCIRKWTSNCKNLISDLPPDHLLHEDFLELDDKSMAKTLGIRWNALSDCFLFSIPPITSPCNYTKREVLSQISKLFDPAGWLAPCIVVAKIIMQQIWIDRTGWDEKLSKDSLQRWKSFQSSYPIMSSIKIPRWFEFFPNSEVQLHGFCDASEKAYAAALYIRISHNGTVRSHLICSKTKIAPIKTLSIPRLELCGATLLADMIDHLVPQLQIKAYSLYCWTDSTIVLSWLAKPGCFWNTFVANRVSKITQVVSPPNWYHVRSEANPADLASRGVHPSDLAHENLWWHGPEWLKDHPSKWPRSEDTFLNPVEIEKKHIKVNFAYFENFDDILERFSSFPRALRVVAYIYRFFYSTNPRFRANYHRASKDITTYEIVAVQHILISMSQKAFYPNEYMLLSAKKPVTSTSSIVSLNPFIDPEGIMRICGRLVSSPALTYDERHPIILSYSCQYSRLLVKFIHDISLHGGNQLVQKSVRTKYWIPRVKNMIKATINRCKPCVIYKHKCQKQLMSALPPERSEISRPFSHTGLDFAGPFDIKTYAGRNCRITKGYVCVFICFSTKAIHLEATSDLSTPTFLAAFSGFVSRRGCPLYLHSDNGTTFVGASKVLTKEFIQTSRQAITSNYAHQNITWKFIPPGAPHMGGLWEAGVKSFKIHFRKVAQNFKHTFEEFQTLLSKIEACLNSRPLSPMSQDPTDLSALTPGHFLIGSPILVPIDPNILETPMSIVNRWQRLKAIHQHFCTRWKDEYLKELHKRYKWQTPTDNLKENTLVVVREENLPPNSWRLGRVTKVYAGRDSRIRVADILTAKGTITRPVTKLVTLPSGTSFSEYPLCYHSNDNSYFKTKQQKN